MQASPSSAIHDLQETLDVARAVTADVKQASEQAGVISTVLGEALPEEVQVDDVAQAIDLTEALEEKLAESAAKLVEVNKALGREITRTAALEAELESSRQTIDRLVGDDRSAGAAPGG